MWCRSPIRRTAISPRIRSFPLSSRSSWPAMRTRRIHEELRSCTTLSPFAYPRCETRSEEHKSELQSLMRNSYAGFCLTKKKKQLTYVVIKDMLQPHQHITEEQPHTESPT